MRAGVVAQKLVVIAGDVDDARALARLAQELLDDVVVLLRPVPAPLEPPAVDDVADEIEGLGVVAAEEIEEESRLARLAAEMDIGQEERAEVTWIGPIKHRRRPALCPGAPRM